MGVIRLLASAVLVSALTVSGGHAEKRVALVIGNSAYRNVPQLQNPANDAEAVGLLLKSIGFEVVQTRRDLGLAEMRRAIKDFSDLTLDTDTAVVFFAGHGIEVDGTNYLIPTDAKLTRDLDVEDEAVSLDRILRVIEPARRFRLVILDACRENPFANLMRRTLSSRSVARGLGRVEPSIPDTLIAFSAKAGSTAADGNGIHSPFTAAVLRRLATPGLDVRIAFGQVRDDVMKATGSRQEPFVYGSLGGSIVALAMQGDDDNKGARDVDAATRDYDIAAGIRTKEAWEAFLKVHPNGLYAELARQQLAKLDVAAPSKREKPANPSVESNRKKQKPAEPKTATKSYPNCRPDYEASYHQSLANARSVGVYPAAMIAQHKKQCGY